MALLPGTVMICEFDGDRGELIALPLVPAPSIRRVAEVSEVGKLVG
jgi:hypothetical protein